MQSLIPRHALLTSIANKAKGMRLYTAPRIYRGALRRKLAQNQLLLIVVSAVVIYALLYYMRGKREKVGEAPDLGTSKAFAGNLRR